MLAPTKGFQTEREIGILLVVAVGFGGEVLVYQLLKAQHIAFGIENLDKVGFCFKAIPLCLLFFRFKPAFNVSLILGIVGCHQYRSVLA